LGIDYIERPLEIAGLPPHFISPSDSTCARAPLESGP